MTKTERSQIKKWMCREVLAFVDECGEVNCTALVEAWDSNCSSGAATLDPLHPAWDVALEVAEDLEKRLSRG